MLKILSILLFSSILFSETETVAVSYFDNTSDIEEFNPLSKGLADMLITDLSNIKSINIVEREKLESLLKEIELGDSDFINKETALGYSVVINQEHEGLLYRNEVFQDIEEGITIDGYVKKLRELVLETDQCLLQIMGQKVSNYTLDLDRVHSHHGVGEFLNDYDNGR